MDRNNSEKYIFILAGCVHSNATEQNVQIHSILEYFQMPWKIAIDAYNLIF